MEMNAESKVPRSRKPGSRPRRSRGAANIHEECQEGKPVMHRKATKQEPNTGQELTKTHQVEQAKVSTGRAKDQGDKLKAQGR